MLKKIRFLFVVALVMPLYAMHEEELPFWLVAANTVSFETKKKGVFKVPITNTTTISDIKCYLLHNKGIPIEMLHIEPIANTWILDQLVLSDRTNIKYLMQIYNTNCFYLSWRVAPQ